MLFCCREGEVVQLKQSVDQERQALSQERDELRLRELEWQGANVACWFGAHGLNPYPPPCVCVRTS